ncbi:MAG: histidine kinase dimerization/phospho-acceptor domain-containing protein [candidate division Zixibacteria bacterium]|nr:histidine kinase dimerization/phospho-acceptor domain-containing protein [candidate division Zixibacteria bacterium]
MLDIATLERTGADTHTVMGSLDLIGVGMFRLNGEGYLIDFNETASGILGVDDDTPWNDLHISSVDRFLSLGLSEQLDNVLMGQSRFIKHQIKCTNRFGKYMALDICCVPHQNEGNENEIIGFIQDFADEQYSDSGESKHRRRLHILADVAAALSSSAELRQILQVILTGATASQGLGFNRAFLFLYDEAAECLTGHLAVGPSSAEEAGHIWGRMNSEPKSLTQLLDTNHTNESEVGHLSDQIAGFVLDLKSDSIISNACRSGNWVNLTIDDSVDADTVSFLDCLGTKNVALVPLFSKGNLRGLLAADNLITGEPITDDAVGLLQILANQAAVAVQRAWLLDDERRRVEELQRINLQLTESQDRAIQYEKMSTMGELTAAIAHRVQNPLDIISGFVNLTLRSQPTSEQQEYLNIVSTEVKRVESVLHHVLEFSHASNNDMEITEFSQLINNDIDLQQNMPRRSKMSMTRSLAQEKLIVRINREQLKQAIGQLLGLITDDIMPSGNLVLRTERVGSNARLFIIMECPEDYIQRIERSLKQMLAEQSKPYFLPLLVTKETLKFHGGGMGMTSGADGYPCLYVELPIVENP